MSALEGQLVCRRGESAQSPFYYQVLWCGGGYDAGSMSHQAWLVYLFHATSNDPLYSSAGVPAYHCGQSHDCCCYCYHQTTYRLPRFYLSPSASIRSPRRLVCLSASFLAPTRSDCSKCGRGREAASCRLIGNIAPQANSHSLCDRVHPASPSRYLASNLL